MVSRYLNIVCVLAVLTGAGVVYDMKMEAEHTSEYVASLKVKIDEEHEAIRVLRAEWSVLNQPARLQGLTERYDEFLKLQEMDPGKQIVQLQDLPMRPVMLPPVGGEAPLDGFAALGEPASTSSIR
ncbi:cell division protein FtsL [Pannonibacter phragmitetus]|uniref:cell division protein FtsL n=1 Tax=Pannonibacter phragmitetus TaxID=121719 RepID=UPI000F016E89|nr:hypothetical protein [Pannonibacter phragmitetus]